MRARTWFVATVTVMTAVFAPMQQRISAQAPSSIVISEFRLRGLAGPTDEFIELHNPGSAPVNIGGWLIRVSTNDAVPIVDTRVTITAGTIVNPGCFYLITNTGYSGTTAVPTNQAYTGSEITDAGGFALTLPDATTIIDQVGHGANGAFGEGTRLPVLTTNAFRGVERRPGGPLGHGDTNNNLADFREIRPSTQNNASSLCVALTFKLPHEVQGNGTTSLLTGTPQTVRGVVTARTSNGFYVQTANGSADADPNTSEGLFVSTGGLPPAAAQVGRLVAVTGVVQEFVPASDPGSPSVTQLTSVTTVTDLGASAVPAAYPLTPADLADAGTLDQLERLEGMRVSADLAAASPTTLDGAFFAVLAGQARPFREPGVEAGYPLPACALTTCPNVPLFDGNPERLRVDSDGLLGVPAVQVSTGASVSATGPLGFGSRTYTLLPSTLSASAGMAPAAAPAAPADHYTVASLNLNQFLEATAAARLGKASLTIFSMGLPDIVGLQEVESLAVLQSLAARIDADAPAAGVPAPAYQAVHAEHANADGLDVAFLVKSGRVTQVSVTQIALDAATEHPSLVLRAIVSGPATSLPQALTVIANQLPQADHPRRQLEAQFLAGYIQDLQVNGPNEAIVSLGGYAAFGFNDGFVDVVGTVKGDPAPADEVEFASTAVVYPILLNLADQIPAAEQYSFVANGNAQAHDHILVSANLDGQFVGLVHARLNADFPEGLASNPATASRLSNRDPLVAYFVFPPDVSAPVFDPVTDVEVEATGPGGAVVAFTTPTAKDNLDPSVVVMCLPESGSTFPIDNTAVICSAEDEAGNASEVSFTVTVQDTTAPALTVPGNVVQEAVSAVGTVVSFTASATDTVSASPTVVCAPASGSMFPLGTTTVGCHASDDAGNSASASFIVTMQDTTAPALTLPANVVQEAVSAAGAVVSFTASATDTISASPTVACAPASGSTFALGTTTVTCNASDESGNLSVASFTVTVRDTTAPALTVPANVVQEGVSAAGTVVSFTASATDAVSESPTVVCVPASGSTFPLGTTTVSCTASDESGNSSAASFTVTVQDTTAPALTVPANVVQEAVSPAGNVVSFTASATDTISASPTVACAPASGSTFALGTTTVTCNASDESGNSSVASFTVTVRDTTAPALTVPANVVQEGVSAAGTVVSFTASATDAVSASPTVVCVPASGSTFPLGTTTVSCSASDESGNSSAASFTVTVRDTTAPALAVPANVVQEAVSPAGNVVSFAASATDALDASPTVACAPASGSTFAVGTTTVNCRATDASGNSSSGAFTVTVRDTTAPVLSLPGNLTATAPTAAGAVVDFVATASDVVTVSPAVTCTPASGSTFAVGETTVTCAATDAAGNTATGSFKVTVTLAAPPPVVGRMAGIGEVQSDGAKVSFYFDVRAAADSSQGGLLLLHVKNGPREGFLAGRATEVRFTNAQTVVFSGVGLWNGVAGHTFEVTASDLGEPGPGQDTFSVVVRSPGGAIVESRSGPLSHGNIKSLHQGGELPETGKMKQIRVMLDREAEARVRGSAQDPPRRGGR